MWDLHGLGLHRFLQLGNGAVELVVGARKLASRIIVHLDVRLYSRAFHDPFFGLEVEAAELGPIEDTSIQQRQAASDAHHPAPGALTNDRPQPMLPESIANDVAIAGAVLVDEQHLGSQHLTARIHIHRSVARDRPHRRFTAQAFDDHR